MLSLEILVYEVQHVSFLSRLVIHRNISELGIKVIGCVNPIILLNTYL